MASSEGASSSTPERIQAHIESMEDDLRVLKKTPSADAKNQLVQQVMQKELSFIGKLHQTREEYIPLSKRIEWNEHFRQIVQFYHKPEVATESTQDAFLEELQIALDILGEDAHLYLHLPTEQLIEVSQAILSLKLSENPSAKPKNEFGPRPMEAKTANGTYFLHTLPGSLVRAHEKPDERTLVRSFVIKPAMQEAGLIGNPQGNTKPIREGLFGGEGAIRERFAYSLQTKLGLNFGIPFTEVIPVNHSILGHVFGQAVAFLEAMKYELSIEENFDLVELFTTNRDIETFPQAFALIMDFLFAKAPDEQKKKVDFFQTVMNIYQQKGSLKKIDFIKAMRSSQLNPSREAKLFGMAQRLIGDLTKDFFVSPISSIQKVVPG